MCKVVEPSSPSISEDAPKFLNQITSLHWKTNHTQRPFIEVFHFADCWKNSTTISLCLWIMTKIQKALDTFLPHSVSGFFYPWCFFCLWCCSTFWPFYIPPRLWTSLRWTAWLTWISKKRATFSKYPEKRATFSKYPEKSATFSKYPEKRATFWKYPEKRAGSRFARCNSWCRQDLGLSLSLQIRCQAGHIILAFPTRHSEKKL